MKAQELLARYSGRSIPALGIFHGGESWFGSEAVRVARERFLGEDRQGFLVFDAPRTARDSEGALLGSVLEEIRTIPMFGGKKLVVYRARTLSDEDVDRLVPLASSPPDFARTIVLLGKLPRSAARKLEAAGALVGEARKLFDTPWGDRPEWDTPLDRFTAERARTKGRRMSLPAAHVLTSLVGNDLGAIDAALAKLVLAPGDRQEIDEEAVVALVGGGREVGAFALGEAVYARDAAKAFEIARLAFREGMEDPSGRRKRDPRFVLGRLLWSIGFRLKDVDRAARALAAGGTEEEAQAALGRRTGPITLRIVRQAAEYDSRELEHHWLWLAEAEEESRTPVPPEAILEALIGRLTGGLRG